MGGTVICCVDDSTEAFAAGRTAAAIAAGLKLRLLIAHVVDDEAGDSDCPTRVLESIPAALCEHIPAELRVLRGDPAQKLAELATDEGADMLVLGARLTGFRGRRLECTLSADLEAATDAPVVLVPA